MTLLSNISRPGRKLGHILNTLQTLLQHGEHIQFHLDVSHLAAQIRPGLDSLSEIHDVSLQLLHAMQLIECALPERQLEVL